MAGDGEAVRFVADLLNQLQRGRLRPGMDDTAVGKQEFLVTWTSSRPLGDADQRHAFDAQIVQRGPCLGYLPRTTHSAHFIADPGLRRAIDDYLKRERAYVAEAGRELAELGPFRKGADEAP